MQELYKLASDGKLQVWSILVNKNVYSVCHGDLNGKKTIKHTEIKFGKNIGKSNETSPEEQAVKEAQAKYDKKLAEGYVTDVDKAASGEIDEDAIEGGINPMLAHTYQDHSTKVKYPVYVQPKLDGHRCIAFKKDGVVFLWSRKRKRIDTVHHITQEVNNLLREQPDGVFLDGELYKHGWTLQRISSAVKKRNDDTPQLEFHVYDCGMVGLDHNFKQRNSLLVEMEMISGFTSLVGVPTYHIGDEDALKPTHDSFVKSGYEGLILRQLNSPYEYKRSYSLLKMKEMLDAEFDIISVSPGKDGTVVFTVILPNGGYSDVTMSGKREDNQKYLQDTTTWYDKQLTVRFQKYTDGGKSLLFPVGLRIREDI